MMIKRKLLIWIGIAALMMMGQWIMSPAIHAQSAQPEIVLDTPQEKAYTNKNKVLFKGKIINATKVTINGVQIPVDENGHFQSRTMLSEPDNYNLFVLKAFGKNGQIASVKRNIYFEPPMPTIQLISPENDQSTIKQKILFKGSTSHTERLMLNGEKIDLDKKGKFYHVQPLQNSTSEQIYILKAIGKNGKSSSITRKITYQPPLPPKFQLTFPPDKFKSYSKDITFSGKTNHLKSLKINNDDVPLLSNGRFEYTTVLHNINGINQFELMATGINDETISIKRNIYYVDTQKPVDYTKVTAPTEDIPVVQLHHPDNHFVTYVDHVFIKGTAYNVKEVYINNRLAEVDEQGNFSERFIINDEGKHVFNVFAIGVNELRTSEIRTIYRMDPNKEDAEQSINEMDLTQEIKDQLNKKISIDLSDADIKDVLRVLSKKGQLNIVSDKTLSGVVNVALQDVTLMSAIDLILNTQGLSYKMVGNTLMVGNSKNLDLPTRLETRIFRLENVSPEQVETVLAPHLTPQESIQYVPHDNLIITTIDPKKIEKVRAIIKRLDSEKIPQILLEAQILEVSKSSLDNLGVAWNNNIGLGYQANLTQEGMNYTSSFSLQSLINILENDGKARVLAKPRIKAINREQAEIFIGDQLPFIELTTDPSGRVAESVKYVDSGITLKILPIINTSTQMIKIKIQPEVTYVHGFKGSNSDIPVMRTRKVNTTVVVKDSNTVLIGGLFNSSDTDNSSKVPLLGNLPLLQHIFTSKRGSKDQTELVIAITPRIIQDDYKEHFPEIMTGPQTSQARP